MTEALLNLGKDLLEKISKEEEVIDILEKMRISAEKPGFHADLFTFEDDDKTGALGITPSDKDIFIEVIDLMTKRQEEFISSLKEQFANL